MAEQYVIVAPRVPLPGALAVIATRDQLPTISDLENARTPRRYVVRAVLSDQIPLSGDIASAVTAPPRAQVKLNPTTRTIYLQYAAQEATFFDLRADANEKLSHVDVEAECHLPASAFPLARSQINRLLDAFVGRVWMPLVIARLELYLKDSLQPIAHQLFLPFGKELTIGPLGGLVGYPLFDPYESLIREAVATSSPFYRFLCAYRLYEGTGVLRRTLRQLAERLEVVETLPSDPRLDLSVLGAMGFSREFLHGLRTVGDLHAKLKEFRHRVAHFLLDDDAWVVNPSDGTDFSVYSIGAAALLHYADQSLTTLRRYFSSHLFDKMRQGEILPLVAQRDRFLLKDEP
jgi:hypothetical protein